MVQNEFLAVLENGTKVLNSGVINSHAEATLAQKICEAFQPNVQLVANCDSPMYVLRPVSNKPHIGVTCFRRFDVENRKNR